MHAAGNITGNDSINVDSTHFKVEFPIDRYEIIPDFADNSTALAGLGTYLSQIDTDSTVIIDNLQIKGCASPDGPMNYNRRLASRRMNALRDYVTDTYGIADSLVMLDGSYTAWEEFRQIIAGSAIDSADKILEISSQGDDDNASHVWLRLSRLKKLNGGATWRYLCDSIFPAMRSAAMLTITVQHIGQVPEPELPAVADAVTSIPADTATAEPVDTVSQVIAIEQTVTDTPSRAWHLSTNAVEWGMFIANIKGEWDFAPHWSAALSLHYSALNYFTSVRKFRTFIFRPEARYWLDSNHSGIFFDGHIQMAAYNFALEGWRYRIQDTGGKHPGLGGGAGVGYRLPLGKSGRWALECQIDAGVYHLKYDRFENKPGGQLVDTRSRTWAGIDNFAISIVYNFNAVRP